MQITMEYEEYKRLDKQAKQYLELKNKLVSCIDYSNKNMPITINISELKKIALEQLDFTVESHEVTIDV